jgi:uncharacterized protein YndB with AHSA1/START domain
MIELKTEVAVEGTSGRSVSDFMLNCTDADYQKWWPGTHLAFHTTKRLPGDLGNHVYFDEYIGERRFKLQGVVVEVVPGKRIVWQMKMFFRLPAWLILALDDRKEGVVITHIIKAGFTGIGRLFDPLLKLVLSQDFERDLQEHAHIEFNRLAEMLS